MKFYKMYEQNKQAEIEKFIHSQPFCYLITTSEDGIPRVGIFNQIYKDGKIFLHLNKNDEQIADLKRSPKALITFHEFLAVIPSYWVDEHYAGAATSYYKYAEFECTAELADSAESLQPILQQMLDHYQPGSADKYDALDPESKVYKNSFDTLVIACLKPYNTRVKWKVGQNRPPETRKKVAQKLRERAQGNDLKAAEEVLAMIETTTDGSSNVS